MSDSDWLFQLSIAQQRQQGHNKLYSMLLAGIFPAKPTEQKFMECSKIK
jgi:hypothetical protein